MRRILTLILMAISLIPATGNATQMICLLKAMPENFETADLVFAGTVVNQLEVTEGDPNSFLFTINVDSEFLPTSVWKGEVKGNIHVYSYR